MRRLSERILSAERVERVRERVREAINQDEAANMAVTFAVKEKNKRILALEKERKLLLEKHRTLQATASALASAVRAKDQELQSTQRFSKGVVSDLGEAKEALQTRVDALSQQASQQSTSRRSFAWAAVRSARVAPTRDALLHRIQLVAGEGVGDVRVLHAQRTHPPLARFLESTLRQLAKRMVPRVQAHLRHRTAALNDQRITILGFGIAPRTVAASHR